MDSDHIILLAPETPERDALARATVSCGYRAIPVSELSELEQIEPDAALGAAATVLIIADHAGPVVDEVASRSPYVPIVVICPTDEPKRLAHLLRRGAFTTLPPDADPGLLEVVLLQAERHRHLQQERGELGRAAETNERLAMIGKLAAGVAHELNNPLDGVARYVNLSIDTLPAESQQIPFLLEARRGLRRMADIVRDLLQFSRNATLEMSCEDAEHMVREAVGDVLLQTERENIDVQFRFDARPIALPRPFIQVISNLARNAVDAMEDGGELTIVTAHRGDHAAVEITDTGHGIPDEIRGRIIEPFFTTKEVGEGTGLGLSICVRIVERFGGTLTIDSIEAAGTCVAITCPEQTKPPANAPNEAPHHSHVQ